MYAIISVSGHQFRIEPGTVLNLDRMDSEPGKTVTLSDCVLMARDEKGLKTGSPTIADAKVKVEVLNHFRDKKITVFKMKRRKSYRRKQGHRQDMTRVRVADISLAKPAKKAAPKAEAAPKTENKPKAKTTKKAAATEKAEA